MVSILPMVLVLSANSWTTRTSLDLLPKLCGFFQEFLSFFGRPKKPGATEKDRQTSHLRLSHLLLYDCHSLATVGVGWDGVGVEGWGYNVYWDFTRDGSFH